MAKKLKVWLNNKLNKCLRCTVVIKFYHIFTTKLVLTFFVFKYPMQTTLNFQSVVSEVPI